jgi:hypothetical protein
MDIATFIVRGIILAAGIIATGGLLACLLVGALVLASR